MTDAPEIDAFHVRGADGIIRGLNEHYDSQWDVEQDPYGAWLAIQNLWTAERAAYLRGLEDAAKVADGMADGRYRTWRFMQGGNRAEDSDEVWIADQIAAAIRALAKEAGE